VPNPSKFPRCRQGRQSRHGGPGCFLTGDGSLYSAVDKEQGCARKARQFHSAGTAGATMRYLAITITSMCAALAGLCVPHANASEYDYTGNAFSNISDGAFLPLGSYLTASVTLNCTGQCDGTFGLGAGLDAIEFAIPGFEIAWPASGSGDYATGYVTVVGGEITQWELLLNYPSAEIFSQYGGGVTPANNVVVFGNGSASNGGGGLSGPSSQLPPGSWSAVPTVTPLPAALPLFASGLGVMGLLGRRRKRKAVSRAPTPAAHRGQQQD
jgi:hypothetical protein